VSIAKIEQAFSLRAQTELAPASALRRKWTATLRYTCFGNEEPLEVTFVNEYSLCGVDGQPQLGCINADDMDVCYQPSGWDDFICDSAYVHPCDEGGVQVYQGPGIATCEGEGVVEGDLEPHLTNFHHPTTRSKCECEPSLVSEVSAAHAADRN